MNRYVIAADVAWVSDESLDDSGTPTAYVTPLPDGPAAVLKGPACLVWLGLAEAQTGAVDEIAALVAEVTETDPAAITEDVERALLQLVERGVAARA